MLYARRWRSSACVERAEVLLESTTVTKLRQGIGARLFGELSVEPFELGAELRELVVQRGDALSGDEARLDCEGIEWLDEVVIGTGLHPGHDVVAHSSTSRE